MKGYMIQGGDPNSKDDDLSNDGYGQPGQETVPAEFSPTHHDRGILSTARQPADVNSATSQFFINVVDNNFLDSTPQQWGYTVFGKVVQGMETDNKIRNQQQITQSVKDEYETKLANLRLVYGRLYNSSSKLPSLSDSTIGTNENTAHDKLACAETTLQLETLQDWIKTQQLITGVR